MLEREIRKQPNSLHTPHLDALAFMARGAERALEPVGKAIKPETWAPGVEEAEEGAGDKEVEASASASSAKSADVPLLRTQPSHTHVSTVVPRLSASGVEDVHGGGEGGGSAAGSAPASLTEFFHDQVADFDEMAADVHSIVSAVSEKAAGVDDLKRLLSR